MLIKISKVGYKVQVRAITRFHFFRLYFVNFLARWCNGYHLYRDFVKIIVRRYKEKYCTPNVYLSIKI